MVEHLSYFRRVPGAFITAETFDTAVQFCTVRGDITQRLLRDFTFLHAPAVAHYPFRDKNIKNTYTRNMHCYALILTGGYLRSKVRDSSVVAITHIFFCFCIY